MMRKIVVVCMLVIVLVVSAIGFGVIPLSFTPETDAEYFTVHGIKGSGGLDDESFILASMEDAYSEKVVINGGFTKSNPWSDIDYVRYIVSIKTENSADWIVVSKPGSTSNIITTRNPGKIDVRNSAENRLVSAPVYQFNFIGWEYQGSNIEFVKVEFEGFIDENDLNIFDGGHKWSLLMADEAYVWQGYGGLYLPYRDGRPVDNFEIGEKVRIGVETSKGGRGTDTPWRVTLNAPYSGSIDDPEDGGAPILEQKFANDCDPGNTFFEFTVTEEMAAIAMSTSKHYSIRLWNAMLPKGTLHVDFIDFVANAPGDVVFSGVSNMYEVGERVVCSLDADANSGTSAAIDFFRVSVIRGKNDVLLPAYPSSELWVFYTSDVGVNDKTPCSRPQSISFTPEVEGYYTIHAKAVDVAGRSGEHTKTFTIYAWAEEEPEDTSGLGEDDYGGGRVPFLLPPLKPDSDGDSVEIDLGLPLLAAVVVFFMMLLVAALPQIPVPGGAPGRIVVIILGVVLAVVVYWLLGGWL